ncbi:hypothetical protein NQ317_009675, partial [Molorchus minor]
ELKNYFNLSVEHMFFILNTIYQAQSCEGYNDDPLKYVLGVSFPNYFTLIKYTHLVGVIVKFSNLVSTFTWIFTDLFITLISLALTARFKQIVNRLEHNKNSDNLVARERSGVIESVYFFYSFGFLVFRLLVVSMYGAWLNDEAKKPLEYLYSVPSEHYCTEISRLIEEIYTSPIGITGSGFFLVTKNFLLQVTDYSFTYYFYRVSI